MGLRASRVYFINSGMCLLRETERVELEGRRVAALVLLDHLAPTATISRYGVDW